MKELSMNKAELKKKIEKLSKIERHVTQEKGTEPPYSGEFVNHNENGVYTCKVCDTPLFSSKNKFGSSSMPGWPSFDDAINSENVTTQPDNSFGMKRTEINCKNCGAHLGHVFDDGPKEKGGKHYCVNSASLDFKKNEN